MKKITLVMVVVALFFGATANASLKHKLNRDLKVALTPQMLNLVEENGMVNVEFLVAVPKDFINKRMEFMLTPYLMTSDNIQQLPSISVIGKRYMRYLNRTNRLDSTVINDGVIMPWVKEGQVLSYQAQIPYASWMQNAVLMLDQRFVTKRNNAEIAQVVYAKGVRTTPAPVAVIIPQIVEIITNKQQGTIKLNFAINSPKIDMSMGNNMSEMAALGCLIKKLNANPANIIESVTLTASSSPDGVLAQNAELTKHRAMAVKEYLESDKSLNLPQNSIVVNNIDENWDMFKKLLMLSDKTNKPEVMKIFDIQDMNQRSKAILKLPQFNFIKKNILPQLRFVQYEISYKNTTVFDGIMLPEPLVNNIMQYKR